MRRAVKSTIFTILFLVLSGSTALFAYLYFFQPGERNLSGVWTAELDMSSQAAAAAFGWLWDIEGISVSLEEVGAYMEDLTIQVNLTFEQTDRWEGTFRCFTEAESYDACNEAAYEAFAMAFQELLAERLRMAGYEGGTDRESMEALVNQAFGMSTASYLKACGPALLPSLEEMQERYDGNGTYTAQDGILTRVYDGGHPVAAREERYIRKGGSLILSEESAALGGLPEQYPVIYTLKQPAGR